MILEITVLFSFFACFLSRRGPDVLMRWEHDLLKQFNVHLNSQKLHGIAASVVGHTAEFCILGEHELPMMDFRPDHFGFDLDC